MKTALIHWFRFLIALLLMSVFFAYASCSKKIISSTEIKKDSISIIDVEKTILKEKLDRSLAINDSLSKRVPYFITNSVDKNCDSLCNAQKENWLKSINDKKQSGKNGYNLYYNEKEKNLVLAVKIDETVNQYKDSLSIKDKRINELQSSIKTIEIPVEKPFTSLQIFFLRSGYLLWIVLIAFFGWKIYKILNLKNT
jgi:hypothetical protein